MLDKNILLINKPRGLSSAQVVSQIKKIYGVKKAGHAGTLDKEAEGLLIIGLDQATKKLADYQKMAKEYRVKIRLGIKTETDDLSGKILQTRSIEKITLGKIKKTLKTFFGEHQQRPPVYSAVKIKGRPAYKLARTGKTVKLKRKTVTLVKAKISQFEPPYLSLVMKTSKGFYVRSFARDLGEKLGCGATTAEIVRTAIGPYDLEKASRIKI